MTDETLESMAERIFISKSCDKKSPLVVAAIITIAMKMSTYSNIVEKIDVLEELLEAYGMGDNYDVINLIGMDDDLVEATIGYRVAMAPQEYLSYKDMYDTLYTAIKVHKIDKKRSPKTASMK